MAYFPVFMDITGQEVLIVGGGTVAFRKVEKLLPYEPQITLVAPNVDARIRAHTEVNIFECEFEELMLEKKKLVIAATDDRALNTRIAALCREKGIPVNAVDQREDCTFLFPALVKRGELSIGISTGGASPTAAIYLKNQISELLPNNFDSIITFLEQKREYIKTVSPSEQIRAKIFKGLFEVALFKDQPLTDSECTEVIQTIFDNHLEENS